MVGIKLLLRPDRPSFAQESITRKQNHALLFFKTIRVCYRLAKLQCNAGTLVTAAFFTYLGVVGEALINDSSDEQQLFKLLWAHCTTVCYP